MLRAETVAQLVSLAGDLKVDSLKPVPLLSRLKVATSTVCRNASNNTEQVQCHVESVAQATDETAWSTLQADVGKNTYCRVANVAGVNMAVRKDVINSQSRHVVAKHPPFLFISPYLRLLLRRVQKIRTTTEEKMSGYEQATHHTPYRTQHNMQHRHDTPHG